MNKLGRVVLSGVVTAVMAFHGASHAQPQELHGALSGATLGGNTRFTVWGFNVYDAALWVEPGFEPREFDRHAFALELTYLRDFTNESITDRSINEMRKLSSVPEKTLRSWQLLMRGAFPDVRKGDRITGVHRPGSGAFFITNGQASGAIRDPEFARLFFGIWLSERTSEPGLRASLLARLAP